MHETAASKGRVLYIAGRMHCGSTFLSVLLGSCPGTISLGEPVTGLKRGPDERCGCGQAIGDCEFWSAVRRLYEQGQSGDLFGDVAWLYGRSDARRFLSAYMANLEGANASDSEWMRFSRLNGRLLQAAAEAARKTVVVDSNKEFTRALMTLRSDSTARLIHLVRDPVVTIGSYYWRQTQGSRLYFMKRDYELKWARFPALMLVAASWNLGILLGLLIQWKCRSQVLNVSYERFCSDPVGELRRIAQFADLDVTGVVSGILGEHAFPVGHNLAGNAELKSHGTFTFVPNASGRRKLPLHYRLGAWILTLPGQIIRRLLISDH